MPRRWTKDLTSYKCILNPGITSQAATIADITLTAMYGTVATHIHQLIDR